MMSIKTEQFVLGACGCDEHDTIPIRNKNGTLQRYRKGHNQRGKRNLGVWRGGRYINDHGYMMIYNPKHPRNRKGYVSEHRLVLEQHLDAMILPWIHVHHKNGNRLDNRIENLDPLTSSQHCGMHAEDHQSGRNKRKGVNEIV
jgi:hypothetical protein